jgi:hypothetical protein
MAGIPTSNILQPGAVALQANRALISNLQLLTPQYWNMYVEKYGNEDFTWWLSTFGGMEEVKNQEFFWFESRGKLMLAVNNLTQVTTPAAGATVTITISNGYFDNNQENPIRVGETLRIASSNIEGEVLTLNDSVAGAFVITVRPKISTQAFVSGGSTSLLAGETLLLAGDMDAGEASDSIVGQQHLDIKYTNTITEMRESWQATDLAEMTEVFYNTGVSGESPVGQAGTSYFTYKGLVKANTRFKNNVEFKLMRGNKQNNTGLSNSVGSQGIISQIEERGETVGYTPGVLDIAKLHEITRIMDVNGCAKQNMWLQDIYQKQNFSDGIFKEYPAGAFVWGSGEKSQEASVAYGFQNFFIDGYMFQTKKYSNFNTEVVYGRTPDNDYFRNYGIICPMGESRDARDSSKVYKNITIMMQQPPKGGTLSSNGLRIWQHGGGSMNPTNGKMEDKIEMIAYRGSRVASANQFIIVQAS